MDDRGNVREHLGDEHLHPPRRPRWCSGADTHSPLAAPTEKELFIQELPDSTC